MTTIGRHRPKPKPKRPDPPPAAAPPPVEVVTPELRAAVAKLIEREARRPQEQAERDQQVADATVAALHKAGWAPANATLKEVIRDEQGRITGVVEQPARIVGP
jgi:hypothetical protein